MVINACANHNSNRSGNALDNSALLVWVSVGQCNVAAGVNGTCICVMLEHLAQHYSGMYGTCIMICYALGM